jgi:hypothetical protein
MNMKHKLTFLLIPFAIVVATALTDFAQQPSATVSTSGLRAAAVYLDKRLDWWVHWPSAARNHDTSCVSCHTVLPYALARPEFHRVLANRRSSQFALHVRFNGIKCCY